MARNLNKERDTSTTAENERPEVPGEPRTQTALDLASELAADAYNIVVALAILSLSYWVVFRSLPVELFTLGLITMGLIAVNIIIALRDRDG